MPKTPIDQSIAADDSMLARVMCTKLYPEYVEVQKMPTGAE
jgi:hypothetical protein